ncbi:Uncharacterised protein [Chlamydia trachomatis]|nr:Uncharacterised protein [Chlamydia trachomatis]
MAAHNHVQDLSLFPDSVVVVAVYEQPLDVHFEIPN